MEITIDNFEETYQNELIKKIQECDFCSIDCELSGITNYKDLNSFDTPKTRYEKIKKNDEQFLILQFGICFFKSNKNSDKLNNYECDAYNCFLFPRSQNSKFRKDSTFSCLNSSIEFLSEQNFDFNKVFNKGISFMSKDNEEEVRHKLVQTIDERKKPKTTLYPSNNKDMKEIIDKIMADIDDFVLNENESKKEIKFSEFLLRIYIEKNIKQKYSQILKYEYKYLENKERLMILTKQELKDQNFELDLLEKEIGFSKFIWMLSQSQKLIIGHNMLTDIMQILRQFFASPLPEIYEDFKSMTNSLFPSLIDTKYMASISPLKELINNSTLGDMDKILNKDPFPKINIENSKYSIDDEKLHEAGYDAFLTGYCFLRMLHYLESFNSSKKSLVDFYLNKIFLMKTYDISFIDLKKSQEEPKRDNVFYLEFPTTWQTQQIFDLFSPYGSVFIAWIDDRSAFVALQNLENVKKAASNLVGISGREYKIYFYQTYINQLSKNKKLLKLNDFNYEPNALQTSNGNQGNSLKDKRKLYEETFPNTNSPKEKKTEIEHNLVNIKNESKERKKMKSEKPNSQEIQNEEKSLEEKPFEENVDW